MPVTRPTFIDFRSHSNDTMSSGIASPRGLPSPRIARFDGDIPPQMSPLDAFAAQSRLLAKKLDDSKRDGRRVSRLPPLTIADSFVIPRQEYLSSRSIETEEVPLHVHTRPKEAGASGSTPEFEEPEFRPKSFYPRMSGIPQLDNTQEFSSRSSSSDQVFVTPADFQVPVPRDYFAAPRVHSPEPEAAIRRSPEIAERAPWIKPQRSFDSTQRKAEVQRGLSIESASSRGPGSKALVPPMSPQVRHAASIRSIPMDSSDDEHSASTGGSSVSQHRKLSSSSGVSVTHSPLSPFMQSHGRSPSQNSDFSVGGSRLVRPTYNFSRPLSRGSRPSIDGRQRSFESRPSFESTSRQPSVDRRPTMGLTSRKPSTESQQSRFADESVQTPVNIDNEQFFESQDRQDMPAPSYIYAKFSLPRGRILQRNSKILENRQMPLLEWEKPSVQSNVKPATETVNGSVVPSITSAPRSVKPSTATQVSPTDTTNTFPSGEQRQPRPFVPEAPPVDQNRSRQNKPAHDPTMSDYPSESSSSMRSGSTIKARSKSAAPVPAELSAEDHLAKGIESHERGDLKESTYHLRIAAKQNLPTAMLLYALACRHGWGMRPNPQEGVQWLRKAADSASLEIADGEDLLKDGSPADILQQKTRRAQFALSIYELGVSHMNGWGIEQDKTLALRCFEIAGNWGDADAMAEAGFCYAQGAGCKKDLKKAAKYYRMAEAKGMSMVGNSWIYKPKYADDEDDRQARVTKEGTSEKKPRDKSRTRTMFGRKKSIVAQS